MTMTKLQNMVNPQVMADMISAGLPKAIKFAKIAKVDTTLSGVPGDTITVPRYKYIGDAKDVAEGAPIDLELLQTTTGEAKVKKAAKGVELTDESVLSGYGDPIGEAVNQLTMSIASKIDNDIVSALDTATLSLDKSSEAISYNGIVDGVDLFIEENEVAKVLFIHPKQLTQIRKDENFIDRNKYGGTVMMTGAIGTICGCEVVVSRRVPDEGGKFTNFIVQLSPEPEDGTPSLPAITIYMKRKVNVEDARDIIKKTTVITADEHYTAHLSNDACALKMTFGQ